MRQKIRYEMEQVQRQLVQVQQSDEASEDSFKILYKHMQMPLIVDRKNINWMQTLSSIFLQLSKALEYLDENNLVHRDIKP